jgi:hypothetical protein
MQHIAVTSVDSALDFDYGEGSVTFAWIDQAGIRRRLTIDIDGHCSREMPIRSGSGVEIGAICRDRVRLRFTPDLAAKLELDTEIELVGDISERVCADLQRLTKWVA